jgi:putative transposase
MYDFCMRRGASLASGEVYHIYNRGAHKQRIFTCKDDYVRFLLLLHVTNTTSPVDMRQLFAKYRGKPFLDIFTSEHPDKSLVDVLAFSLLPNHFHLILRQKADQGISTFLRKVSTAYSMYFNTKYAHSGILSQGPFKSRHIDDQTYFRYIFSYVHLNPLDNVEPAWKMGIFGNRGAMANFLSTYKYSSFYDYFVGERPERAILAYDQRPDFLKTQNDLEEFLRWYTPDPLTKVSPL